MRRLLSAAAALSFLLILHFFCLSGEGFSSRELELLAGKYRGAKASEWGERVTGVAVEIRTAGKEAALTFDACGGPRGSAVDFELLEYLKRERIPATLFLSGRWIRKNMETVWALAADPLFEIENHGANHRPLSISGKGAYGIPGTVSVTEAAAEVEENAELLERITGSRPRSFRSGTNHYDEVAVSIAAELGHRTVGYSVNGDGGASFSKKKIAERLLSLRGGEIVLFHMNRPEGWTAEGLKEAIPLLRKQGFRFVRLSDRPLVFTSPPALKH